jgi:chaperone modulatory protein CbpM
MENDQIAVIEFCMHHQTDQSFVVHLHQAGLINLVSTGEEFFIPESQLESLERLWRLHTDLDINLEGIETVVHLLDKIEKLNLQLNNLRNQLRFYEEGF